MVSVLFAMFLLSLIVVAIALPAIQNAREAERRTQVKNNLKQIAQAMHNYQVTESPLTGSESGDVPDLGTAEITDGQ